MKRFVWHLTWLGIIQNIMVSAVDSLKFQVFHRKLLEWECKKGLATKISFLPIFEGKSIKDQFKKRFWSVLFQCPFYISISWGELILINVSNASVTYKLSSFLSFLISLSLLIGQPSCSMELVYEGQNHIWRIMQPDN